VPQTTVEIFNLAEGNSHAISLKGVLNEAGFRVLQSVHRGKDVSGILAGYKKSDAELLIICLSRGIEYVPEQAFVELHQRVGPIPIVFVLESGNPALLNSLMDNGGADYLLAPLRPNEVVARISRLSRLKRPLEPSVAEFKDRFGLQQFIGDADALFAEIQKIPQLARCNVCVLICGETGTGKELVARTIHRLSMRSRGPFVPLNCGAIPADLVENELFGHEAGAFTGASTSKAGLIREAEGGTILLDEVDSLPLLSQVKLLRFLQDKEYRPLGAHKAIKADVRVIAASNIQFEEAIQSGRFRADLYYRLNVTSLRVPALRQRKQDIPMLVRHFLTTGCEEHKLPAKSISAGAIQKLFHYEWPGNVRELQNVVENALINSRGAIIAEEDVQLPERNRNVINISFKIAKAQSVTEFETSFIRKLLAANNGNITKAANAAKQNRRVFRRLMQKYNIERKVSSKWDKSSTPR
jgi:two-component system response regulator GlrR